MQQPGLGKKIAELRKARGLTQEELVEKCNLSVRTLQRIEAGEVTPRSYTLRAIFAALDHRIGTATPAAPAWPAQLYGWVIDLFNLKTNTMKKVSILSIIFIAISFMLIALLPDSQAQTPAKAKKAIESANRDFVRWFNNGRADSLTILYHPDACLVARGCGSDFIFAYYTAESAKYKFSELRTEKVTVSDSLAVESGQWAISLPSGQKINGEYLTEWKWTGEKWVIFKDMAMIRQP